MHFGATLGWKSGTGRSILVFPRPSGDGLTIGFQMGEIMKRRDFIKVTGLGAAGAATIAAPAIAQSMPVLKWRMTASWPKSLDTIYGGADVMCKAVAEATDNKFQIQLFAAGEIVPGCRCSTRYRTAPLKWGIPLHTTTSARTRPSHSAPRCRLGPTRASIRAGSSFPPSDRFPISCNLKS